MGGKIIISGYAEISSQAPAALCITALSFNLLHVISICCMIIQLLASHPKILYTDQNRLTIYMVFVLPLLSWLNNWLEADTTD